MWCEQREYLLTEYRKAKGELAALPIRDKQSTHHSSAGNDGQPNDALAATANARFNLHEHVDEHRCWTHSVYSALFFPWRNGRVDVACVSDHTSKVAP
jgi:hypothetical protein